MYTVYGIPNCDTVKKALNWLKANHIPFEFHDYKKKGVSEALLHDWLRERTWEELLNRNGTTWRQTPEDQRPIDTATALLFMQANPSVIRRPIVANGSIVALGFNETHYQQHFLQ